ncbi:MAG: hypothetical protein PHI97_14595 [Desulfobulbus sp.]|nr:hypothetical protein [Desulfobulbus sp.]
MEISSSTMASQRAGLSILKSANQQPELAGDLISKTIAGLQNAQTTQDMTKSIDPASSPVQSGNTINIVA